MNAPADLIDRTELDGGRYAHSLLSVAQERGLLSASGGERIQADLLALLAAQAERYTQGESTSVSTQTAGELLESILYTIGAGIKPLPPMQALAELECGGAARFSRRDSWRRSGGLRWRGCCTQGFAGGCMTRRTFTTVQALLTPWAAFLRYTARSFSRTGGTSPRITPRCFLSAI